MPPNLTVMSAAAATTSLRHVLPGFGIAGLPIVAPFASFGAYALGAIAAGLALITREAFRAADF